MRAGEVRYCHAVGIHRREEERCEQVKPAIATQSGYIDERKSGEDVTYFWSPT